MLRGGFKTFSSFSTLAEDKREERGETRDIKLKDEWEAKTNDFVKNTLGNFPKVTLQGSQVQSNIMHIIDL